MVTFKRLVVLREVDRPDRHIVVAEPLPPRIAVPFIDYDNGNQRNVFGQIVYEHRGFTVSGVPVFD